MKKSIKYLFLLVTLILGGIGLVACNKEKVLAKEEDAYMMQAVSAVNIGGNSQSVSNPNVRLDSDNSFVVEFENQFKLQVEAELGEVLAETVDLQLKLVEDFLTSIEITHGDSDREGYEHMSQYESLDLLGRKVKYTLHYKVVEVEEDDDDEVEIEYIGVLVTEIEDQEPVEHFVNGEVEIEDGERKTSVEYQYMGGKVEIKSSVKNGERKFEYKIENDRDFDYEFELKIKNQRDGIYLEIETEIGDSEVKFEFVIREVNNVKRVEIKIEIEEFKILGISLEGDIKTILVITTNETEIIHNYNFDGELEVKEGSNQIKWDFEFDYETRIEKQVN